MILEAIVGALAFIVVPPIIKCAKYPDLCIQQFKEDVGYIKGNYTSVINMVFSNKEEVNTTQGNIIEYNGDHVPFSDYNATINNNTTVEQ